MIILELAGSFKTMKRPIPTQPSPTVMLLTENITKTIKKNNEEMYTFINCNQSKFRNDLLDVVIKNSIQPDDIFEFFQFTDFRVPDISKSNKVKNLKQTPRDENIFHV